MPDVWLERDDNPPVQRLTVIAKCLWCFETHQPGLALDVPLPTTHRHRPAALHQEAITNVYLIAGRQRRQTRGEPIEWHADTLAAVDHVIQEPPIGALGVGRLEQ